MPTSERPKHLTATQFHDAVGFDDWRVVGGSAMTVYRTTSFSQGVGFAVLIADAAAPLDHHPDVDIRPTSVTVKLTTHSERSLTVNDVALANAITEAAKLLEIPADPSLAQSMMIAVDAVDPSAVMPFWKAVMGYTERGEGVFVDPRRRLPLIWFDQVDQHRPPRNRIHLDIQVPPDVAQARVAAALDAGGRMLGDKYAPAWWSLIDAEGNVADIATWEGRA
jgi:4a-hydroxytetrahydrobiopterin dehydratase